MRFGILMQDNTPVDPRFRRFRGVIGVPTEFGRPPGIPTEFGNLRSVPGVPFGRFAGRRFGGTCYNVVTGENYYCDDTLEAAGIDPTTGTVDTSGNGGGGTSSSWQQQLINAGGALVTDVVKAFTNSQGQQTCPPGYYLSGGKCIKPGTSSSSSMGTVLAVGAGIAALVLLRRRRPAGG